MTFTDFNVSTSNQSRINIAATATLSGTPLTEGPQFAAGGLNGDGSESSLYNQTTSNTPSNMGTNLGLFSIGFPGDSESQAANATGLLGNNLAIAPGVGGVSGTDAADYGLLFTSPQDVVIQPIDISSLNIPGITTLNLGTLTGINLNVACGTSPLISPARSCRPPVMEVIRSISIRRQSRSRYRARPTCR